MQALHQIARQVEKIPKPMYLWTLLSSLSENTRPCCWWIDSRRMPSESYELPACSECEGGCMPQRWHSHPPRRATEQTVNKPAEIRGTIFVMLRSPRKISAPTDCLCSKRTPKQRPTRQELSCRKPSLKPQGSRWHRIALRTHIRGARRLLEQSRKMHAEDAVELVEEGVSMLFAP